MGLSDFQALNITTECKVTLNDKMTLFTNFDLVCDALGGGFIVFIKSSLIEGNCSVGNPPMMDGPRQTVHLEENTACRNNGSCIFTNCFRANVVYENISVIALMTQVVTTITLDKTGTWRTEVQTSSFKAAEAATATFHTANITAYVGYCDSPDRDSLRYGVGSTIMICVSTTDTGTSLTLKNVKANPGEQTLVDSLAQPNFVTRVVNHGTSAVNLETLMIPAYFDMQSGINGTIIIEGTAQINYARRHLNLEGQGLFSVTEENTFLLEIPLVMKDTPMITGVREVKGGSGVRLPGIDTFAVAVAALVFFFLRQESS